MFWFKELSLTLQYIIISIILFIKFLQKQIVYRSIIVYNF